MAQNDEIIGWSADTLSQHIRQRDVSCVEVMDAYLGQIERHNPQVNAIVAQQDADKSRAAAVERDAQLARGEYCGWMHGMPQAIKDLAHATGFVTSTGSPLFKNFIPPQDSVIVERAKAAGAIVIGKTNVPEWGLGSNTFNPVYGATVNPYDLTKCVGGSSGGTAAALALRMLPVADGSDMGGSIRNPSAFCNTYGLRPTQGVVPMAPTGEVFVQQFGTEGPMGRTVKDVAMLLSVQAGHDPRAPLSVHLDPQQFTADLDAEMKGKRIAWMGDWNGYFATDPGVLDICESALQVFRDLGCIVEAAVPDFSPDELWDIWLTQRAWIIGNYLRPAYDVPEQRALIKADAQWEVEQSFGLSGEKVFASTAARTSWLMAVNAFFEKYDYLIAPSAQVFPFDVTTPWPKTVGGRDMETYHQWMGIVLPWTLAGTPVMGAPVGFNAAGLPMGIQIIGKRHAELAVLQMARAYEAATGWIERCPPPMLAQGA